MFSIRKHIRKLPVANEANPDVQEPCVCHLEMRTVGLRARAVVIETEPLAVIRRFKRGLSQELLDYGMLSVSWIELSVPWINRLKLDGLQLGYQVHSQPLVQRAAPDFSISMYKSFH